MKKIVFIILVVIMLAGCTGFNPNVVVNNITDAGFVLTLQNNPSYKPEVIKNLDLVKVILAKDTVTYSELIAKVAGLFKEKYGFVFYLLMRNIETDIPIIQNPLNKLYRDGIIKKIDELIFLANTYVK